MFGRTGLDVHFRSVPFGIFAHWLWITLLAPAAIPCNLSFLTFVRRSLRSITHH